VPPSVSFCLSFCVAFCLFPSFWGSFFLLFGSFFLSSPVLWSSSSFWSGSCFFFSVFLFFFFFFWGVSYGPLFSSGSCGLRRPFFRLRRPSCGPVFFRVLFVFRLACGLLFCVARRVLWGVSCGGSFVGASFCRLRLFFRGCGGVFSCASGPGSSVLGPLVLGFCRSGGSRRLWVSFASGLFGVCASSLSFFLGGLSAPLACSFFPPPRGLSFLCVAFCLPFGGGLSCLPPLFWGGAPPHEEKKKNWEEEGNPPLPRFFFFFYCILLCCMRCIRIWI